MKQNALLFGSCFFMSYRLICIKLTCYVALDGTSKHINRRGLSCCIVMSLYLFGLESFLEDPEEGGQTEPVHVVDLGEITDHKVHPAATLCQR